MMKQRLVRFIPTQANKRVLERLLNEKGNPLKALRFEPITEDELKQRGRDVEVLMWGNGEQHQYSYYIDIAGAVKLSIDAHMDADVEILNGRITPKLDLGKRVLSLSNHLAFSSTENNCEVRILIHDENRNAGVQRQMAILTDSALPGIISKSTMRDLLSRFRLVGTEHAIQSEPENWPRLLHVTVDCDAIKCFPIIPQWIAPEDSGFSIEEVAGIIRRARLNGRLERFDFGGLINEIQDFELLRLQDGYAPAYTDALSLVLGKEHGNKQVLDRVLSYAARCYQRMLTEVFDLRS